jgi:hypothetical protein
MKIYRYPKSNPQAGEVTDQIDLGQQTPNLTKENYLDCDISVDKDSSRKSGLRIYLNKDDLKYFHEQYPLSLEQEIESLREELKKKEDDLGFHSKAWRSVLAAISELHFEKMSVPDLVYHCEHLAENLQFNYTESVSQEKLNIKEVTFKHVLFEENNLSPSKALKHLIIFSSKFSLEMFDYIYLSPILPYGDNPSVKVLDYINGPINLKEVLSDRDPNLEGISPGELLDYIISDFRKKKP